MSGYSDKVRYLMHERKISGQKIADMIGVSQKTVSRYVTGETKNEEMQKKILEAIAQISGYPEDAVFTDFEKPKIRLLATNLHEVNERSEKGVINLPDDEIFYMEMQELNQIKENACNVFALLEEKNQQYVLQNFDILRDIETYEIVILEKLEKISLRLSKEYRDSVIESLERVPLSWNSLKKNGNICKKVSNYFDMMTKCSTLVEEDSKKFKGDIPKCENTLWVQEYADKLEKASGVEVERLSIALPNLVTMEQDDWEVLILIQLLRLEDKGYREYYGNIVGDKLYMFFKCLEKLEKEEKEN